MGCRDSQRGTGGDGVKKTRLFVELLLCVGAAWFVFSVKGFLPRLYSLPIPAEKQQYHSPFYITGNSYVNQVIVNYQKDTVEPRIMEKLDVFSSNNIDATRGYYDKENDRYYFANKGHIFEYREKGLKQKEISDVGISRFPDQITATPVKYNSIFFKLPDLGNVPHILGGKGFIYETPGVPLSLPLYRYHSYRDEKNQIATRRSYNFQGITQALHDNETENISLEKLSLLLWITRNRLLLGWYPEAETAVFAHYDEEEGKRYITRYTVGSDEPESFHLTLSSDTYFSRYDESRLFAWDKTTGQIYLYNYATGEKQDIVQAPELTLCRYRIQPDKKLLIAGITSRGTVWSYWESDGGGQGELDVPTAKGRDLTMGTHGFCLSYPEDGAYTATFYGIQSGSRKGETK